MATKVWIGTDGDWATVGNWSPSGIPVDNDTVIIPDGASALTSNLDRTADATDGLELAFFFVSPKFVNDVGASGTPLKMVSDKVEIRGTGTTYLQAEQTSTAADMDHIIVNSTNLIDAAVLTEANTSTMHRIDVLRGGVTIGSTSANVGELNIAYDNNGGPVDGAHVKVLSTANGVTDLYQVSGTCTMTAAATRMTIGGTGTLTHDYAGAGGTLRQCGGLFIYDTLTADGSLLEARLMGGVFDSTRTAGHKTITDMTTYPGGVLIRNDNLTILTTEGGV